MSAGDRCRLIVGPRTTSTCLNTWRLPRRSRWTTRHLSGAVLAEAINFPTCAALSGDGEFLVAGTAGGEVWLWQVADRAPVLAVKAHGGPVYGVSLSGDGRLLATGGEDGTVRVWEAPAGRLLVTLRGHVGGVRSLG
jgi:WD40 repeat protein